MVEAGHRAIAIVGAGAVMPEARDVAAFWENVKGSRYSITEVPRGRWDPDLYYDPDPAAPDKTYSKIGGWVQEYDWNPLQWRLPLPPRVVNAMDDTQKWAVVCTRAALEDYGYPKRPLNAERTAVILGNAMAGEKHYLTSFRVYFPEYTRELLESASFASLPPAVRTDITRELHQRVRRLLPEITEDSMPGELANCIAGRVANLFNFHGPNFVTDAACASAMAALDSAVAGLVEKQFDVAITGGIDRNMGAPTFVKFSKIGALSATGSRPFAEGADGFVMGEGGAVFILKRLADAERDGDRIYAVIRGLGGSSDGRGKGITAPNPVGQKLAIERAWEYAGESPASATLVEAHGTSTRVGDVVEVESMTRILAESHLPVESIALGSVKSNIGHLKGAAGAAGLLKLSLALRDKVLPPSVRCERRNPGIDFAHSPLFVNTELRPWTVKNGDVRRACLSAFGFGGTNFHAVVEEHIPYRLTGNGKRAVAVSEALPFAGARLTSRESAPPVSSEFRPSEAPVGLKAPLRGALVIGADSESQLAERLRREHQRAANGEAPPLAAPSPSELRAKVRLAIDYADAADLAEKCAKAVKAFAANHPGVWKALRAQGIFLGRGPAPKIAFLYTGQGSQYVNMFRTLRQVEPIVADTFAQADPVMTPLLGKPLTDFLFVDELDAAAVAKADDDLRQTAITQPAVLTADLALTRLLAAYGVVPDMAMGHSLGEYGALTASGALPFEDALVAVSARGREMTRVAAQDHGRMAAVFAPLEEIERVLRTVDGYVVIANINSNHQAVIGGASKAVEAACERLVSAGYNAVPLPVSHAFHTSIVAAASVPLRALLAGMRLTAPRIPIVANLTGEFYPMDADAVPKILDILGQQVAAPVQFIKGLKTLYGAGARVFVELGPKKALQGFAEDVLGDDPDVLSLFTNHPKLGDTAAFNQALCGMYAMGLGANAGNRPEIPTVTSIVTTAPAGSGEKTAPAVTDSAAPGRVFADATKLPLHRSHAEPKPAAIAVTGAALGLPGNGRVFDDANLGRLLQGEQFIGTIPAGLRNGILDKNITRLVKSENGGPVFEKIQSAVDVIKLAGRAGEFDLVKEFGVSTERLPALDRVTQLAIAVGLDALRDAGIPLVMRYKTTTKGTQLPDCWQLPEALRDNTGVIFASAFPGCNSFADETARYYADRGRREQLAAFEQLRAGAATQPIVPELDRRIDELRKAIAKDAYTFDRRFIFRILSMGHSQFAEYIGARGPNTQINAACASTTQACSVAEDWIRANRCRRVVIVSADDITADTLIEWMGAAFLATGVAATDEKIEDVALPFDRRRHGMIIGMGAAALVVEDVQAPRERGIQPICEVLSTATANSAFHGTRLDPAHITQVMETLVSQAEAREGISREELAEHLLFVSHETYTPARGGSAAAEVRSLRTVFGEAADRIVIANTKGFTGHAMGAGIEDVVAVKALQTGCVPPVANFKEVDPELGPLNLSKGGNYPVEYALRLGAGFGSQISMSLLRRVKTPHADRPPCDAAGYAGRIADPAAWNAWLCRMTGKQGAELEVVNRTLRVRDGVAAKPVPQPQANREPEIVAAAPPSVAESVEQRVLAVVAGKTGYPKDMLALDLDLEADLGVDTVKQAEVFAAIREYYGIERDPNLKLREFPTLAHVIRFVHDRTRPSTPTAPAPAPVVASAPVARPDVQQIRGRVLAIVAEKTGYPKDMLDLDLDLEADLGIDTVKQAEMFAAIREAYGIPRDPNLKLREFPTLAHVIRFAEGRTTPAPPAPPVPPAPPPVETNGPAAVKDRVLEIVAEKTGYPKDMLDLDLDLEADLGIDTVKQAEMFAAIREAYGIPRDPNLKLREFPTLAHVIRFAEGRTTPAPPVETNAPAAVKDRVLEIVAEKTGYPKDMLDLDLDLEADLGIDTVKQAEMFAAIREAYGIPRDPNLKLREFPTLAHVIRFAEGRTTPARPVPPPVPATPPPAPAGFDAADGVPRRVPVPVLRPLLTRCRSTAISLGPDSRVTIMPDLGGVAAALATRLKELGVKLVSIQDAMAGAPVNGVYWLPALDAEVDLSRMDAAAWRGALQVRVKSLYSIMRKLCDRIAAPGSFLVSATRLGGLHGYEEGGAFAPLGGAVAGFTKAYRREQPEPLVKVVDFEAACEPAAAAELLIEETLRDPAVLEVGWHGGERFTIALEERSAADGRPGLALNQDTVFLITGAAGSIVSAITADLAAASGGTFYLLDVAPEPDPGNPDIERFATDREGLKRDLFARIQARGERATPALVERELAQLERARAASAAMAAVRAAGGTAQYFAVNLTDGDAVARVVEQVRRTRGRIDVLLHAAGLDRSRFLAQKEPAEFDLVFDVKADGLFHLLRAAGDMPLKTLVVFSSIAGRFGNAGQTDYSAANDLLCKIVSSFRTTRPGTRAIALDWTAWSGMGMAMRGSIPQVMQQAGIEMLPPEAGIPWIRRELTTGGSSGEIVVARGLGVLIQEHDLTGGLAGTAVPSLAAGPMCGRIAGMGIQSGLTIETTLDPAAQPFLYDHRIEGTPVLPGVMGIEAFAEAALWPLPGWHIDAIEDVDFLAPVKFYRGEPRQLTTHTLFYPDGDELLARCRLTASRALVNQPDAKVTTHFTACLRLAKHPPAPVTGATPALPRGSSLEAADIYRVYFHGPAYQVVERAWWDERSIVARMAAKLPPNHMPVPLPLAAAPRLIELCFQTAGLWEMALRHRMGLPMHIDSVRLLRAVDSAAGPLYALVTAGAAPGSFDAEIVDEAGARYLRLGGYRTAEFQQVEAFRDSRALQGVSW